jgi:hypothetical protein
MTVAPRGHGAIKALAAELRVPVDRLLALSQDNDPFYCGREAHSARAKWFAHLWERFAFPMGVHIRRIHYVLVSQKKPIRMLDGNAYENTDACFLRLVVASKFARHLGLVDADAFTDHRNPEPHIFAVEGRPEDYDGVPGWALEEWQDWDLPFVTLEADELSFPLPDVQVSGYDYCQADQPYHLELWIEKSTMNDVLTPVCQRLHVNLVTGVGFQSITGTVNLLKRVAGLPRDKPTRLWYVSDFDPAGDAMPVATARQIEFYLDRFAPGRDIKLTPVALTREQVVDYDLPRIPIKTEDRRGPNFEDRRGEGAVELDALEALYPGELASLVTDAVEPYRDDTLNDRLEEAHEEAEDLVREAWDEATEGQREELEQIAEKAGEISERYREKVRQLNARLQSDLKPLREELNRVRRVRWRVSFPTWRWCYRTARRPTPARPTRTVGCTTRGGTTWISCVTTRATRGARVWTTAGWSAPSAAPSSLPSGPGPSSVRHAARGRISTRGTPKPRRRRNPARRSDDVRHGPALSRGAGPRRKETGYGGHLINFIGGRLKELAGPAFSRECRPFYLSLISRIISSEFPFNSGAYMA